MIFLCYPKCSTCVKARNWLKQNNIDFEEKNIYIDNPSYDELKTYLAKSGLPIKRFFNTSGILYKEMDLKNKLTTMNEDEMLKLLSSDGRLVKRPLLIKDDIVLVGFKEEEWEKALK